MHLILVVPGLLDDPEGARTPELAARFAGAALEIVPEGIGAALAPHYGVVRQRDWPLAPLRIAASGVAPGASYWLRATPVSLVAGRDDVRLSGVAEDLDATASTTLLALLNDHFR